MRFVFVFFFPLVFFSFCKQSSPVSNKQKLSQQLSDTGARIKIKNDTISYEQMKANIRAKRKLLLDSVHLLPYEKRKIRIQTFFVSQLADSILPYWYNTPWDFNGTTETPGKGKIACGYFVTTTIRDMSYKINRYKIAQMASTGIIKSFVRKKNIRYYYNNNFSEFIANTMQQGYGIYIVGLDNHVGYLYHDGNTLYFIHSTFVGKSCVVKEIANQSPVLAASQFRVTGKISDDDGFLEKWASNN